MNRPPHLRSTSLPPEPDIQPDARRARALARLASTGNIDAVARGFSITPAELAAWAAEACAHGNPALQGLETPGQRDAGSRVPPRRPASAPPPAWPSSLMVVLSILPLPAWPIMALWAVIGGFIDRGSDAAVFGWTLVLYPFVQVPCLIAWTVSRRRIPALAPAFLVVPCVQILVCVAAFWHGLAHSPGHR